MKPEEKVEVKEISFKDKAGNLDLRALMTGVVQKLLGISLDYSRISGMSDRSFNQMQRSLKDSYYQVLDFGIKTLEESKYIEKTDANNDSEQDR